MEFKTKIKLMCSIGLLGLSSTVYAQNIQPTKEARQENRRTPEQRQELKEDLQQQLGITQQQLHSCLEQNRPQGKPLVSSSVNKEEREQHHTAMLICLQKSNPSLTKEKVLDFMKSHHPLGPARKD